MNSLDIVKKNLAELFEEYFERRGGTQKAFAAAAGVHQGQVSLWIRTGVSRLETLDALARGFGLRTVDLLLPGAVHKAFGGGVDLMPEAPLSPIEREILSVFAPFDDAEARAYLDLVRAGREGVLADLPTGAVPHQKRKQE